MTGTGQTLGGTVDSILPGTGGIVTGVTGTVGGVVTGVQNTVTGTLDQTLGGVLGGGDGLLPAGVLDTLLGTLLGNSTAAPGTPGTGNSGGVIVLSGGSTGPGGIVLDASAPRPTVKVLSKLKQIGSSGKMKLEIRTNEPGIVAVAGNVRPGAAVRAKKGAKVVKHSRKIIKVPQITLGYRKAGKLVVTVRLSRAAQRALGRSKSAKMSVGTLAVDVFKNQDSDNTRINIKR
ncbi:MAG TPA: hypothetical protein VNA28_03295 [Solirubrobacteraceae bacterium]|nr:hypothetical protein [Solirubrobacteraceae bacterium]